MIRLGLVGCGAWGWRYIPAALEAGNCKVTHVLRVGESCPEEGRRHLEGLTLAEHASEIAEACDAVVVAAPPTSARTVQVCSFLSLGRPVMAEKPLALSSHDANEMVERAEQMGVALLVNHQHLFAPAYEVMRELVKTWSKYDAVSRGAGPGPVRFYSALWDYGAHDVAMALGLDDSLRLTHANSYGGNSFHLELTGESKRIFVDVSNVAPTKQRSLIAMNGTSGEILTYDDLDLGGSKLRRTGTAIDVKDEKPLTRSVRAFAQAVEDKSRGDWRFGRFGADVVRILEQADDVPGGQP